MADNNPIVDIEFDLADIGTEVPETPAMETDTPAAEVQTPEVEDTSVPEIKEPEVKEPVQRKELVQKVETSEKETETPEVQEETEEEPSLLSEIVTKYGYDDIDPSEFDDSTDGLIQLTNTLSDRKAEETLDNLFNAFPTLQQHFEYLRSGGDPNAFMDTVKEPSWGELEVTKENSKDVLRNYFKARGEDDSFIEDMIEAYEDKGVLTDKASQAKEKLAGAQAKKREALVEQQRQQAELQKQESEKVWNTVKGTITSSSEFSGIPLTEREKPKFIDFISAPVDREGRTQRDIAASKLTLEQQLAMDLLLFKGMDLKKIVGAKAGTEKASGLRQRLERSVKSGGGKARTQKQSSGDSFEDLSLDDLI